MYCLLKKKSYISFLNQEVMPETTQKPSIIEKEMVAALSFHDKSPISQHPELFKQIDTAVRLGNAHHSKVSIIFQDDSGLKRVDTTLWANGAKFICLKGGIWIPIDRILEIKL